MKRLATRVAVFALLLLPLLSACTPVQTFRNPELGPADLSKTKVLLLPVDVRGLPGEEAPLIKAVIRGVSKALSGRVVDLAPGAPNFEAAGLEDLGWETGTGMFWLLEEQEVYDFGKAKGPGGKGLPDLPGRLARLAALAKRKFDLRFTPRYLLAVNVQGRGEGVLEGTVKYRIHAGFFDLEKNRIHTYLYIHDTMADDAKALARSLEEAATEIMASLKNEAAAPGEK